MIVSIFKSDLLGGKRIEYDPRDWRDMQVEIKRSEKSWGLMKKITFPSRWVKDGYVYIKTVYEAEGPDGRIDCQIYHVNDFTGESSLVIEGTLNLTNYKAGTIDLETNIEGSEFETTFYNNVKQDVNILDRVSRNGTSLPLQSTENFELPVHSRKIKKQYIRKNESIASQGSTSIDDPRARARVMLFGFTDNPKDEILETFEYNTGFIVPSQDSTAEQAAIDNNLYFLNARESGTGTLDINMTGTISTTRLSGSGDWDERTFQIFYKKNDEAPVLLFEDIDLDTNLNVNIPFTINYSTAIDFVPEDKFYFFGNFKLGNFTGSPIIQADIVVDVGSSFEINADTSFESSNVKGKMIYEAFERITQIITNQLNPFYSETLGRLDLGFAQDGKLSMRYLTNGYNLRERIRAINYSFEDLYEDLNSTYPVGYEVEKLPDGTERVRIETIDYFFDESNIIDIGLVSNLSKEVDPTLYFNRVEVGYVKYEDEGTDANSEINTSQKYGTKIKQFDDQYKIVSKTRADSYGIEIQRRNLYINSDDKDKIKGDEDNYWIETIRDGGLFKSRSDEGITNGQNLPDKPHNIGLSPKQNLINHLFWLKINYYKKNLPLDWYQFVSGNGNIEARFTDNTLDIDQDANLLVNNYGDRGKPKIWPEIYRGEAVINWSVWEEINSNPKSLIKFSDEKNNIKYGYLKSFKTKIDSNHSNTKVEINLIRANYVNTN